jgi:hypothetical protein
MEGDTCLQGILRYLLIYLFISKALRKERPYMFPKSGALMEMGCPFQSLNISFGVPSKGALPPGPPAWSSLEERCPVPRTLLHSSIKIPRI